MPNKFVPLSDLVYTEPSLSPKESLSAVAGILDKKQFPNWIRWDTDTHTDFDVSKMAEMYVNRHAALTVRDDTLYSTTPIHVLETQIGDRYGPVKMKGLWYSNGAVLIGYRDNDREPITILYVDKTTAESFNYPMPS